MGGYAAHRNLLDLYLAKAHWVDAERDLRDARAGMTNQGAFLAMHGAVAMAEDRVRFFEGQITAAHRNMLDTYTHDVIDGICAWVQAQLDARAIAA